MLLKNKIISFKVDSLMKSDLCEDMWTSIEVEALIRYIFKNGENEWNELSEECPDIN